MGKHNREIVRLAREHVFALFRAAAERIPLEFHQFRRTREVVDACKEIAKGCKLGDEARQVVLVCAWFYDACYATGSNDHARSLELCLEFMKGQQASGPTPEQITDCFHNIAADHDATAAPGGVEAGDERPSDVLHDARLAVLAARDYVEQAELLRLELERTAGTPCSDGEWTQRCIEFFGAHDFRTRFAQLAYGHGRAANLVRLQKQLRKQQRQLEDERADEQSSSARGVAKSAENMFYHFTRLHLSLFNVADHRTSTMVHVNAIMMSIAVALLARRIATERDLLLPTCVLLAVNLAVVFLAVHSLRAPRTTSLTGDEARRHQANVLAFTNEQPFSLSEYAAQMSRLATDPEHFQSQVVEHLYIGRKLLHDRTRALRRTYDVFMYGVALAMVAFVVTLARR